jgi:hypothetical protein
VIPSWAIIFLVLLAAGVGLYLIGRGNSSPKVASAPHTSRQPVVTTAPPTVATRTRTVVVTPKQATLTLTPTGSVWVCVETPAGTKLVDGVVENPGSVVPTLKEPELLVTLGNASVTVTADGKMYPLSPSATAIGLKITPRGVSSLPQGPTCA